MDPFISLHEKSPQEIVIRIKDVDLSIINSMRRVILSEIDNIGFFFNPNDYSDEKDIIVITNDTPLHNEFLQHRLSMIPINVNADELENWDDSAYKFVIDKTNNTSSLLPVYSNDIKIYDSQNKLQEKLSSRFFPPDKFTKDYILITKLNNMPNARLHIEAKATKGNPKKTTSYGIVSNCSLEFVVDDKLKNKEYKTYFESNKDKMDETFLKNQFETIEVERLYHRNKYREPNLFDFKITSECAISGKYIFGKALEILKSKILKFQNSDYEIVNTNDLFNIFIKNEDHTLGNLFQAMCFNEYIRENNNNTFELKYIGYNIPHPLENILLIKISGDKIKLINDVRNFIDLACDFIYKELDIIHNYWNTLSNK